MTKLYFDIESLPAGEEQMDALKVVYDKKLAKNPTYKVSFEDFHRGTSFEGEFGRILCIGYAIDDGPLEIIYENGDEVKMLKKFWQLAKEVDLFIGHNIIDYDMRFIYQRSMMLKVKPTLDISFARYRSAPMYDTMKEWGKWSIKNVSLERLALSMGIPTPKEDIDGSQVYSVWKAGGVDKILEYCKRDVDTTRQVYKRMTFQ